MNIVDKRSYLALGHPSEVGTHDDTKMGNSIISYLFGWISVIIVVVHAFLDKLFHSSGDILATLMYYSLVTISGRTTSCMLTLSKDPLRAIIIYLKLDLCSTLCAISVAMINATEMHPTFAQEFLKGVAEHAIITW